MTQGTLAPGATRTHQRFVWSHLIEPYLYLTPALVLIALVMLIPLVVGVSYSFQSIMLLKPGQAEWVALDNYLALWSDTKFWISLENTLVWTFGSLFFQFTLGLGLALLLNTSFPLKRLFQAIVFLPWAVPTFLTALTWAWLFNPLIGPLPHWLAAVGVLPEPFNILGDPDLAIWGPIAANIWFGVPFFAITLLAALQSIPSELYEAAEIDGATAWQSFTKITLPFLAPMIAITVMLRTIWIANFADLIFIMTGGGPNNATLFYALNLFRNAFEYFKLGKASAMAWVLFVILLIITAIQFWGSKRWVHYEGEAK